MKTRKKPFAVRMIQGITPIAEQLPAPLLEKYVSNLFLRPVKVKHPKSEQKFLSSAWMKKVRVGNHDIMTYEWGNGSKAVFLVHGWAGRATQFRDMIDFLIDHDYRVTAFDLPSHGLSSGSKTSIVEIGTIMMELQKTLGHFESAITHSFGGICLLYARSLGFTVHNHAAIAAPAIPEELLNEFCQRINATTKSKDALLRHIQNQFDRDFFEFGGVRLATENANLNMLVVHDEDDREADFEHGVALAAAANARLIATKGLGHKRILRDPETIESVISWLKQQ